MKKCLSIISLLVFCLVSNAQNVILHNSGNNLYAAPISEVDSIKLDDTYSRFSISGSTSSIDIQKSLIDSITFTDDVVTTDKIYIIYNGTSAATIINPYSSQGVVIAASGGTVTVTATSGISDLEYNLLGTSSTGSLTMSSTTPAHFVMNNLNLTNASGSAILISGGQTHTFTAQAGTANSLTDGTSNTKNGTLQTDGKIIFDGAGSLAIKGIRKHAVSTSALIEVQNSTIIISSAASDGFHSEGYLMNGGNLTITSKGDGIDAGDEDINISNGTITATSITADVTAIKTGEGTITISGGTINLTVSGAQSKGIKAKGNLIISGGTIGIALSGPVEMTASGSGYEVSYSSALNSDAAVIINEGTITIEGTSAATGARGISADGDIEINGGTITITLAGNGYSYTNATGVIDSYSASCIKTDANIRITGGDVTLTNSGHGGKGLNADHTITIGTLTDIPVVKITTTGRSFLVAGVDYAHPKTIVAGGAITIVNGNNTIASTDDGIHSDASITISGGNTSISAISLIAGDGEGIEAPLINISGGLINITATNDGINATYGRIEGGDNHDDNSQLTISGGILIVAGRDAIDSNGDITITGGTTILCGPMIAPEEGIDYNGTFLMNGGLFISAGSNFSMTSGMDNSSAQVSLFMKSSVQLPASTLFHIEDNNGTELVTFMPKNAVYYFHFSSAELAQNTTYKIYFGGSYTGGNYAGDSSGWGLYTGGTYSTIGATQQVTFTTSNTGNANTISF